MLFPGDLIVVSLTLVLSVPLFIVQLLLLRKNHRLKLLPLAVPGLVFLSTFFVDLFAGGSISYYRSEAFISAVLTLVGNWFLVVLGLAWFTARMGKNSKK